MKKIVFLSVALTVLTPLYSAMAQSESAGDIKAGKKVFKQCKSCHEITKDRHKTGPSLVHVFGRTAGTAEGFKKYSGAMKDSGIVWDEKTIAAYLTDPKGYIKGNKMAFRGLKKQKDIVNLLTYMKQYSQ